MLAGMAGSGLAWAGLSENEVVEMENESSSKRHWRRHVGFSYTGILMLPTSLFLGPLHLPSSLTLSLSNAGNINSHRFLLF